MAPQDNTVECRHPYHLRRLQVGAMCVALALVAPGCKLSSSSPAATVRPGITQAASDPDGMSITVPGSLAAGFAELQAQHKGSLGLAVMPIGGQNPVTFGDLTTGPAWATMQIPLAVAVLRSGKTYSQYSFNAAIAGANDDAADNLWKTLGTSQQAATAVQNVLHDGGDTTTTVSATKNRAAYSSYSQGDWALADQARFAAHLPCMTDAQKVLTQMSEQVRSQQWGLGDAFPNAKYKGGAGPGSSGDYLVRQFGIVTSENGQVAIALAARPTSSSASDGIRLASALADLVSKHVNELAGGSCPS